MSERGSAGVTVEVSTHSQDAAQREVAEAFEGLHAVVEPQFARRAVQTPEASRDVGEGA